MTTSTTPSSTRAARPSTATSLATIIYTSGTTGRPKGVELTHGNFLTLAENTAEKLSAVVKADGASTLLFLPLAHVFARFIEVLAVTAGRADGPLLRPQVAARRLLRVPADLHPRRAAGVREDLQLLRGQGRGRRQGQDLRRGRRRRHRLVRGAGCRERAVGPARAPRALRQARLRQAARGDGRQGAVRRVRRRPARHPPRPLLPRHRGDHPRGLRPHRDHRPGHRQPPRRDQDRHGRPAAARRRRAHRRRRRDLPARDQRVPRLPRQRHGHQPRRSATAGSTPATSASSTTTGSCGSPGARRRSS